MLKGRAKGSRQKAKGWTKEEEAPDDKTFNPIRHMDNNRPLRILVGQ